jgi:replicative DNA helicase
MSDARTLPHSIEAEAQLLSCCLLDGADVISRAVSAGVGSDSFYDPKHGITFAALLALVAAGKPTEPSCLAEHLKTSREFDVVGGYAFLVQISATVPTTAQAAFFIAKVREQAALRQLIRAATKAVEDCYEFSGGDVGEMVEQCASTILAVGARATTAATWKESLASAKARVDRQLDPASATEPDDALSFGFSDMDDRFSVMRPGQVVVLAARPSVGKSSLARQIAWHNAIRAKEQVIFASLEVMGESLALNLAQTVSSVALRSLEPSVHPASAADYRKALKSLDTPRLDVIAASNVSLAAIRARCQILRARGTPVRLIVIDYLQLLPDCVPAGRTETRAASVGRASRAIKRLATDEACVVLLLSQLNRDSAKDNREPAMHDLRESGDIEQDADKIVLLHRPSENPDTKAPQPDTASLADLPCYFTNAIQAKGRDDGTGFVSLNFRRAITRFEQMTRLPKP